MTVYPACRKQFNDFVNAILIRGQMDESVFQLIEQTKQDFRLVRSAIDPAMSAQNVAIQALLREYLKCACPIYFEEKKKA